MKKSRNSLCFTIFQASFTNTAYFMVAYPSQVSTWEGIAILFYGLLCTYLEYQVDHQKEEFRATDGNEHIWGQKPQYLVSKSILRMFF